MKAFLMKCPECGKHFDVERTSDRVETKEGVVTEDKAAELMKDNIGPVYIPSSVDSIEESAESVEVPVVKMIHEETFRCKHCGYTWTESHTKVKP